MDYTVTYYKSDGWDTIHDHKQAKNREKAENIFEAFLRDELKDQIQEGHISDQEFTNIVCNGIYTYSDDNTEVTISIELTDDIYLIDEDE